MIELMSIIGLTVGAVLTLAVLKRSLRRTARVEEQLRIASEAFHAVLMSKFDEWQLTPAERDNALLIVKGFTGGPPVDLAATEQERGDHQGPELFDLPEVRPRGACAAGDPFHRGTDGGRLDPAGSHLRSGGDTAGEGLSRVGRRTG